MPGFPNEVLQTGQSHLIFQANKSLSPLFGEVQKILYDADYWMWQLIDDKRGVTYWLVRQGCLKDETSEKETQNG